MRPDDWHFPYLDDHLIAIDESSGALALIDDAADELFAYRLDSLPQGWYEHLKRERNCLVVTGIDLQLAIAGMTGVDEACASGKAFGAMVMVNDGSVMEGIPPGG